MRFILKIANWLYFCEVRRFDFASIHMMLKSAMISLLQYQDFTNFSLVYVFRNFPSMQGILSTLKGKKNRKYDRYIQGRDSKSDLRGDVGSLWLIGWAMLDFL